ncbi:hypothetical protein [Helicobacter sp. 13S00477-4]|uniref:hypothetical protein n=1 Tax=Helicobacter sp. 13S00477-4 TaxID=1905759 RepID=UPI000BA6447E|nr:hypothetical protein [Helicobacter sp. 13S00477-4]PAF52310.1 hypothetical protein BKH44_03110 [Helicobacter sp. 13S00477-4]
MKKSRNFWPYGILAVIVIGVILLVWLVKLSVQSPVIDDNAYFEKYDEVDKNINSFMKDTKIFLNDYSVYIGANQTPPEDSIHEPLAPYFIKGHRDKLKEAPKVELFTNSPNQIYVLLVPKKISSDLSGIKINLFMVRYHMKKEHLNFNDLHCDSHNLCRTPEFDLDMDGRWKAILQIEYTQNNKTKKIYFEKEFFASKHS